MLPSVLVGFYSNPEHISPLTDSIDLLSNENIVKTFSSKQLAVWNYINEVKEATPREISKNTGVARPTINQVTNKLFKLNKIEKIGLGRSTRYKVI